MTVIRLSSTLATPQIM